MSEVFEPLMNERESSIHSFSEQDAGLIEQDSWSSDIVACHKRLSETFEELANVVRDVSHETTTPGLVSAMGSADLFATSLTPPESPKRIATPAESADLSTEVDRLKAQLLESHQREEQLKTALSEARRQKWHAQSTRDVLLSRSSSRSTSQKPPKAASVASHQMDSGKDSSDGNWPCCESRKLNESLLECLNDLRQRHEKALATIDELRHDEAGAQVRKDVSHRSRKSLEYPSSAAMTAARQRIASRSVGSIEASRLAELRPVELPASDNGEQANGRLSDDVEKVAKEEVTASGAGQTQDVVDSPVPTGLDHIEVSEALELPDEDEQSIPNSGDAQLTESTRSLANVAPEEPVEHRQPEIAGHASVQEAYNFATYNPQQQQQQKQPPPVSLPLKDASELGGKECRDQSFNSHSPAADREKLTYTVSLRRQQRHRMLWPSPESILFKFLEQHSWRPEPMHGSSSTSPSHRIVLV